MGQERACAPKGYFAPNFVAFVVANPHVQSVRSSSLLLVASLCIENYPGLRVFINHENSRAPDYESKI